MKIINYILILFCSITLYFSSVFWIGSKEQFDDLINTSKLMFFFNRIIFNSLVIFFFLLVLTSIKFLIFKKETLNPLKKIILFDMVVLNLISISLIIFLYLDHFTL